MNTTIKQEENKKKIIIFSIMGLAPVPLTPYGVALLTKMTNYAKKNNINVNIEMERASLIESRGKEADIIVLTPDLSTKAKEIKDMFPNKIVRLIKNKDYGLLDAENIFKNILL